MFFALLRGVMRTGQSEEFANHYRGGRGEPQCFNSYTHTRSHHCTICLFASNYCKTGRVLC